jgi:hypothetical protein
MGGQSIGIHINGIKGRDQMTKSLGQNPFEYLGLLISADGKKGTPTVWDGSQWVYYSDLDAFGIKERAMVDRNRQFQFSHWLSVYDWVANNGFSNFNSWIV